MTAASPQPTDEDARAAAIEAAVRAILPNVTNETHAWNTWNNIASNADFRRAIVMIDSERRSVVSTPSDQVRALIERAKEINELELDSGTVTAPGTAWGGVLRDVRDAINALEASAVSAPPTITDDVILIPRPVVPFGPVGVNEDKATAQYLREVIHKIEGGYTKVGGSNVTRTVMSLLANTATVLENRALGGEATTHEPGEREMRCPGCDCDPVGYAPHNGKGDCPPKPTEQEQP